MAAWIALVFILMVILGNIGIIFELFLGGIGSYFQPWWGWGSFFEWACIRVSIVVDIVIVLLVIADKWISYKASKEKKEKEQKKRIQDEIEAIVSRYTNWAVTEKSNVPNIAEVESPLIDAEVVFCVKNYIREAEEQERKIVELKEQIQEILNGDSCLSDERRLEYLKQKEPLLQSLNAELQKVQKSQDARKIVLNETASHEFESIREAIQEIRKSKKIRNMNDPEWKNATKSMLPDELRYFKSTTVPIVLRLMDYYYCIFVKTILVFTSEGKFVTALQRTCFTFSVERIHEVGVYFDLDQQEYSSRIAGTDSRCVEKGLERHTWCHTCKDGSMDLRYRNNYRINYRYDTVEYGKIKLSMADFMVEYRFSSEKALLIAEKVADEVSNKEIERENNNKSAFIKLLQFLAPSSKSVRALEKCYSKLDVPQKKYCYIERS